MRLVAHHAACGDAHQLLAASAEVADSHVSTLPAVYASIWTPSLAHDSVR
jgi:hypothetical protein